MCNWGVWWCVVLIVHAGDGVSLVLDMLQCIRSRRLDRATGIAIRQRGGAQRTGELGGGTLPASGLNCRVLICRMWN